MSIHEREITRKRDRVQHRTDRRGIPVERLEIPANSNELFAPTLGSSVTRPSARNSWSRRYLKKLLVLDAVTGLLCSVAAALMRFNESYVQPAYYWIVPLVGIVWVVALGMSNAYERRFLGVSSEEYRAVGRAVIGMLALLAVASFLLNWQLARAYVLALIPMLLFAGLITRQGMRHWLGKHRCTGQLMQRTIVVGRADAAASLLRSIRAEPTQGLLPVAVCASGMDTDCDTMSSIEGIPVMGTPRDAIAAADLYDAEVVAVASHPDLAGKALRRLAWALEERGIELIVSPGLLDVAGPRMSIRPSNNLSLLHVERPAHATRSVFLKDVMDRSLAFLLLLMLAPVLITVALAVKITDPGPVFFKQKRVGVRGEIFYIFKFRTMVVDAEKRLEALRAKSDGNGVLFKMKDDPRITGIGKVLRRYSLDELPQLFNVLFGDMSLVGPRPPLPAEVEQYEPDALRRLHVRPGMTGLWQVSGRSDLSWEESLRLDLRYVDNWSPIGDLHILFRTFRAVTHSSGAY
ncbi:Undecaprenyl-phosphate galactose phosphotransferase, WbaP/exopolysaccharide biosynthesis polyprenyl glycosylphosphotransferase [Austwickia chelonae]|nr:Undecaprenyl-phosphate galactose phosphotransferase, WbaP/exopolysaccharide biosynthesis polyprenyl glycosylphosphotransferase [Austwickia chelonae]